LQGFEVPALVLIANYIDGLHNNKLFSRCISNLILVFNEELAHSLTLDINMAQIIDVYGELKTDKKNYSVLAVFYTVIILRQPH